MTGIILLLFRPQWILNYSLMEILVRILKILSAPRNRNHWQSNRWFKSFLSGLDDFRVYNRTLSDTEVTNLFGNGEGDFGTHRYDDFPPVFDNVPIILLPKDAVLHWTFDNLDGSTITDISGYQNVGIADTNDSNFDLFLNNSTLG